MMDYGVATKEENHMLLRDLWVLSKFPYVEKSGLYISIPTQPVMTLAFTK